MPPRTTRNSLALDPSDLTENEGSLLALVLRHQPITAYQLTRHFEQSPLSSFNTSKGAIYPAISRLRQRGLLAAEPVAGDKRGAERLLCTPEGQEAVRRWVKDLRDTHFVPTDPLRTRVMSFELLPRDEQIEWIVDAKAHLAAQLEEVEAHPIDSDEDFQELVRANAVSLLQARLQWLDKVLHSIVKSKRAVGG